MASTSETIAIFRIPGSWEQDGFNDSGWEIWPTNYSRFITQIDPEKTSIGLFRVGGTIDKSSPIYARFARSFENSTGKNAMYFQLHDDMFDGTKDTVTFIVRYLDKENGSTWSFVYDAGMTELKEAYTVTCNGSGTWKTQTITELEDIEAHELKKLRRRKAEQAEDDD